MRFRGAGRRPGRYPKGNIMMLSGPNISIDDVSSAVLAISPALDPEYSQTGELLFFFETKSSMSVY